MNAHTVPSAIRLWPDPEPLWVASDGGTAHCYTHWAELWRAVHSVGPRLVIIDPLSAAFADVSPSETSPVRAFLRALTREAAPGNGWAGCGVLLVAHDTKSARDAIRHGETPGAGVVAGSAAWYDGARGVLSLTRDRDSDTRLLECVKANYGRTGWGALLRERTGTGGAYRGLELGARLDHANPKAAKPKQTRNKTDGGGRIP